MLLRIKVKPNAKSDEVFVEVNGTIKVRIKALPVDGKANKYLVEFMAQYLGLSRSKVCLLKGETSANKTLEIDSDETVIMSQIQAQA